MPERGIAIVHRCSVAINLSLNEESTGLAATRFFLMFFKKWGVQLRVFVQTRIEEGRTIILWRMRFRLSEYAYIKQCKYENCVNPFWNRNEKRLFFSVNQSKFRQSLYLFDKIKKFFKNIKQMFDFSENIWYNHTVITNKGRCDMKPLSKSQQKIFDYLKECAGEGRV